MAMITKYDLNLRASIIRYAGLGYSISQIARKLGIHRSTLHRWINKYELTKDMLEAEREFFQGKINEGFLKLAEGAKETQEVKERYEKINDAEYEKTISKVRILPPNEKALQILSRRFAPDYSDTKQQDDTKHNHIALHFDTRVMNLRELKELNAESNPLGDIASDIPIDATYIPVDNKQAAYIPDNDKQAAYIPEGEEEAADILEGDASNATPPGKDSKEN